MQLGYKLRPSALYRKIGDRVLVINGDSNDLYYFDSEGLSYFDFFKSAQTLDDYLETFAIEQSESVQKAERLIDWLVKENLFEEVWVERTESVSKRKIGRVPTIVSKEPSWQHVFLFYDIDDETPPST
jgi:hypothetical protein